MASVVGILRPIVVIEPAGADLAGAQESGHGRRVWPLDAELAVAAFKFLPCIAKQASSGTVMTTLDSPGWADSLTFSMDNRILAVGRGGALRLWDIRTCCRVTISRAETDLLPGSAGVANSTFVGRTMPSDSSGMSDSDRQC